MEHRKNGLKSLTLKLETICLAVTPGYFPKTIAVYSAQLFVSYRSKS